jgi:type II secretory pathway pseudopilin PulG
MKRKAFTLLETIISLAIAMVVMGAALTANRVVQRSAQLAEVKTQEEAILSNAFDMLNLTQNALQQTGKTFLTDGPNGTFYGMNTNVNSAIRIAPYRFRQQPTLLSTDPSVIKWCTVTDPSCAIGANNIISSAGPTSGNFTMGSALSVNSYEVIAVHRTTDAQPQIYDFGYLPSTTAVTSTSLAADNATDQSNWDFYRRAISITNRTSPYAGYTVTVSVFPMLNGQNRQSDAVTRTVFYNDY